VVPFIQKELENILCLIKNQNSISVAAIAVQIIQIMINRIRTDAITELPPNINFVATFTETLQKYFSVET